MASKPTIVVAHGAWHSPTFMEPMAAILRSKGYEFVCPLLPTMSDNETDDYKDKDFFDDAHLIRGVIVDLVDQGKDVLVVAHSYGGQVISEAVHESLGKVSRAKEGKPGGVIGLFYICAFLVPEGTIGATWFMLPQFGPPTFVVPHPFKRCTTVQNGAENFYNDLPPEAQKKWQDELRASSLGQSSQPTTYAAQRHFPTTYLRCSKDKTLVPGLQQYMLDKNREAGIGGIREAECDASHSPFLSMPEKVVDEVIAAADLYSNAST